MSRISEPWRSYYRRRAVECWWPALSAGFIAIAGPLTAALLMAMVTRG